MIKSARVQSEIFEARKWSGACEGEGRGGGDALWNNTICIRLHFENEASLPHFLPIRPRHGIGVRGNKTRTRPPARTNSFESGCNFEQPGPPGGRGGREEVVQTAPIPKGTRESPPVRREVRVLFSGQISVLVVYEFLYPCGGGRGRRRGREGDRKMRDTENGVNVDRSVSERTKTERSNESARQTRESKIDRRTLAPRPVMRPILSINFNTGVVR